jgi:hypothetical protein
MSNAVRELIRFVCKRYDVIVVCNSPDHPANAVAILASPIGRNAVEQALPDTLRWNDLAADLHYPDGWQSAVIAGVGAEIAKKIEQQTVSVHVVDRST